jgi:hypothetical protein
MFFRNIMRKNSFEFSWILIFPNNKKNHVFFKYIFKTFFGSKKSIASRFKIDKLMVGLHVSATKGKNCFKIFFDK